MPIQAPQWTDYLNCPVCCREFGAAPRTPISLKCGHTLCRQCINNLHRKQCPFDQTVLQGEPELVVNTALLQLAGYPPPAQPYHPPSIQVLSERDKHAYDTVVRCMEHLSLYLKYCSNGNNNTNTANSCLSRPMQRKLVTLLQCAIMDEEGRGKAVRAARSLGERTVTELILQHQNPQQLSANLWASVRARGCQFLGPAMQEEVLKLVLLALEDGSALSRKVLVMFVVQRLEPHFPQASKTSIGHVVQLLYRASCFKVSKRECDSSLMQLKEEFRTYESLRREHDAQIVQIATEAGLRIAPDQWSALLYGDTAHKSHMQSIIDKLQTPQSFALSIEELFIALHRTGDPARLVVLGPHLGNLANIDPSPEAPVPSWTKLAEILSSLAEVVAGLAQCSFQNSTRDHNKNFNVEATSSAVQPTMAGTPNHVPPFKTAMCRDVANGAFCPRGTSCKFAHSDEELESYRNGPITAGNFPFAPPVPLVNLSLPPPALPLLRFPFNPPQPVPVMPNFVPGLPSHLGEWCSLNSTSYNKIKYGDWKFSYSSNYALHPPAMVTQNGPAPIDYSNGHTVPEVQGGQISTFGPPPQIMQNAVGPQFFGTYLPDENSLHINNARQPQQNYQFENVPQNNNVMPPPAPRQISPYGFEDLPSNSVNSTRFLTPRDPMWSSDHMFNFEEIRNSLPCHDSVGNDTSIFNFPYGRELVHSSATARGADHADRTEDVEELEEGLQALERYIDVEYKSAD